MTDPMMSVKQVAQLLSVRQHSILNLVRTGQLRAVDVSLVQGGRPRWRILPDDLEGFILRRTHQVAPPRRRRRRPTTNLKAYF